MNPHHLPAGRPDGGQFTFSFVGAYIPTAIDWDIIATRPEDLQPEQMDTMRRFLRASGVPDGKLVGMLQGFVAKNPRATAGERYNFLAGRIQAGYRMGTAISPVGLALGDAMDNNAELLAFGGNIRPLANDSGDTQMIASTNRVASTWLDSFPEINRGEALVYNAYTGRLRTSGYCVPLEPPKRTVGTSSSDRTRRNAANAFAVDAPRKTGRFTKTMDRLIASRSTKGGRLFGSDDYAGRIQYCAVKNADGSTSMQPCLMFDSHEADLARMYADELGSAPLKTSRAAQDTLNTEVGKAGTLHEDGVVLVGDLHSHGDGLSQRDYDEKRRKGTLSDADVRQKAFQDAMFAQHDAIAAQRADEARRAGRAVPTKTPEQREQERENARRRRLNNKRARELQELGFEPIKRRGGGWIFPGELARNIDGTPALDRNGRPSLATVNPDYARARAAIKSGLSGDQLTAAVDAARGQRHEDTEAAAKEQERRARTKMDNRARRANKRARDKAADEASASGKRVVRISEPNPKNPRMQGRVVQFVEGDEGFAEALKNPTAQVREPSQPWGAKK